MCFKSKNGPIPQKTIPRPFSRNPRVTKKADVSKIPRSNPENGNTLKHLCTILLLYTVLTGKSKIKPGCFLTFKLYCGPLLLCAFNLLCGSTKLFRPPPRRKLEIPGGWGGGQENIPKGRGVGQFIHFGPYKVRFEHCFLPT